MIKHHSFRFRFLLLLFLTFGLMNSCNDDNEDVPANPIEDLKGDDWMDNLGKEVTIEAFLSLQPEPMLLFDFEDRNKNQLIPESRYIRLAVDPLVLREIDDSYHGARVRVTGTIAQDVSGAAEAMTTLIGSNFRCIIDVSQLPTLISPSEYVYPGHFNLCEANPAICTDLTVNERQTYVMIFSGGINSSKAYLRYWNDMVFFHFTLTWILGVDVANIKVVYKNGVGEDGYMPVHYAASIAGVDAAFNWFDDNMDANDRFIFFATNHGGDGYADANDDESDNDDEAIFYYNESTRISDDLLAERINGMTFSQFIGIFEPCFGGGLIRDLRGENRVMVSASTENQVSWGGLTNYGNSYDHFVFYLTSALAGQFADGTPVDADTNNDGKVSMAEAFEYARVADDADEIPQIEADGNGVPSNTAAGESGTLAQNTFIGG